MANKWTHEQLSAIDARGDILVSAAAGSGKTAVLTERLAGRIASGELSAEDILCVTFTNAAAAEMKQRIAKAVSERAKTVSGEERRRLRKELSLINSADISTIDAFCIKLVRADFQRLGIDPAFKIADQNECKLLRYEVAEELFSRLYDEENADFYELVRLYCGQRSDDELVNLVLSVYEYMQTEPDTHEWLDRMCADYAGGFSGSVWEKRICEKKDEAVNEAVSRIENILTRLINELTDGGFCEFDEVLERFPADHKQIKKLMSTKWSGMLQDYQAIRSCAGTDYDSTRSAAGSWTKKRLIAAKPDKLFASEINAAIDDFKNARDLAAAALSMFTEPSEVIDAKIRENIYPNLLRLCWLIKEFDRAYTEEKEKRGELEFSDIEHLCFKLLRDNPDVRRKYAGKYAEILLDEFQDTNALQDSIFTMLCDKPKRFCVGDIKQSIYRFRGGDPSIFRDRSELFARADTNAERIILSNNFRSRREVLDGVNEIFADIMRKSTGELDYDDTQRLNTGDKSWRDVNGTAQRPELCVIESADDIEDMRAEARFIAQRITKMKRGGFLVRDKNGEYRPLKNSDVVVIMNSVKAADDIYSEEFSAEEVPVIALNRGYFERNEIKLMMSLIKIISNPMQDIPLIAVMRSVIGGFSDDELARIRIRHKKDSFYAALADAAEDDEKCAGFLGRLEKWRDYSKYMGVDRLIWTLLEETGFYDFAGAYYNDGRAQANLRLLYGRAKQYENSGFKGLFNFIAYVERMEESSEDISGAPEISEGADAVRLMTIHKSKGLEFPVVFAARCSSRFMLKEDTSIPVNKKCGFGMPYTDADGGFTAETPMSAYVREKNRAEMKAEEMRKLYVLLTRAKEKLIMTAVVKDADKFREDIKSLRTSRSESLADSYITGALCFRDWAAATAAVSDLWELNIHKGDIPRSEKAPDKAENTEEYRLSAEVGEILGWEYPYMTASIPSKISVSDIKRLDEHRRKSADIDEELGEDDIIISKIDELPAVKTTPLVKKPRFMEADKKPSGAALGTIYHTVLSEIRLKEGIDEDYVKEEIRRLCGDGLIPENGADALDAGKIAAFFQSGLGKRLVKSSEIRREVPFELLVESGKIPGGAPGENVIVQGIIDCMFREDGEYVLIDYKSDYYTDPLKIREKYDIQLEFYRRAIEKITKVPVKEAVLYLLYRDDVV